MPHDRNNEIIKEGDIVHVPCVVKSVQAGDEYWNVTLETVESMPPGNLTSTIVLNTRQTVKVE